MSDMPLADSIKAFGQLSYIRPEDKIILIDLAQSIGRIERDMAGLREKVEAETIERCAKVAEKVHHLTQYHGRGIEVAEAIRAIKDKLTCQQRE